MGYNNYKKDPALSLYVSELIRWNSKINLIGRQTEENVWSEHIRDSMKLVPFIEEYESKTIIDIGSGGGFPAIPLAIALPDKNFYLTEVIEKKLSFLDWISGLLNKKCNVSNLDVYNLSKKFSYDGEGLIISRAYGSVDQILKWRDQYAKSCQNFLLLKGTVERTKDELKEMNIDCYSITPTDRGTIVEFSH